MLTIKTILHPTDLSEHSQGAFHLACSLARDHGARLVVLHVVPTPVAYGEVIAWRQPDSYFDQLRGELDNIQSPFPEVTVEHVLEEGDPDARIIDVAKETPCDLIVMGTHGRTGLTRLLMGSVAEKIVRAAPCPVLTAKTPFAEAVAASDVVAQEEEPALV